MLVFRSPTFIITWELSRCVKTQNSCWNQKVKTHLLPGVFIFARCSRPVHLLSWKTLNCTSNICKFSAKLLLVRYCPKLFHENSSETLDFLKLYTLLFQLEDTVLFISTFLLFEPVLFPKYEDILDQYPILKHF